MKIWYISNSNINKWFRYSDIDECASTPCQNGGTCSSPNLDAYVCTCVDGSEGTNCETGISKKCKPTKPIFFLEI